MKNSEIDIISPSEIIHYIENNERLLQHCIKQLEINNKILADIYAKIDPPKPKALVPAVPIEKSITYSSIICLEDGKHFKSMSKHLKVHYGLTPDQYRAKWQLPPSYPMVSPEFSARRSKLSVSLHLGRKKGDVIGPYGKRKRPAK